MGQLVASGANEVTNQNAKFTFFFPPALSPPLPFLLLCLLNLQVAA